MDLRFGMSYAPSRGPYVNYHGAVRAAGSRLSLEVETLDLSADPEAVAAVDAILFTGGPDVDPGAYGMSEYLPLCMVDTERDALERRLFEEANARRLPIFAICRGAQLLNVMRGGTLIPDLPDIKALHHGQIGGNDRRHPVDVESGTLLAQLAARLHADVNSSPHQAVDRVGDDLLVAARADDGTVEAMVSFRLGTRPE